MTLVLETRFARYRLVERRGLSADDLARVVNAFELRSVLGQWLSEEMWPRMALIAFCDRLDLAPPQMPGSESDRAAFLDRAVHKLDAIGGPVLLREVRVIDRRIEKAELEERESSSEELHWIEVQLVDENDQPVAGVGYEIKLTDGRIRRGTTNSNGVVRYEHIPGGNCDFKFVTLDEQVWEPA